MALRCFVTDMSQLLHSPPRLCTYLINPASSSMPGEKELAGAHGLTRDRAALARFSCILLAYETKA